MDGLSYPEQSDHRPLSRSTMRQHREELDSVWQMLGALDRELEEYEQLYRRLGIDNALIDAFHHSTPLEKRSFYQPWISVRGCIKSSIEALGDVAKSHYERFMEANQERKKGNTLMKDVVRNYDTLQNYVDLLSGLYRPDQIAYIGGYIVYVMQYWGRRSWVESLPETKKLLSAGMEVEQMWFDFLAAEDDHFVDT
ncbi:hypothetical protein P280DRAFT_512408 [Massarina eburnea CBS 473.64]|uniref:Uncharacterized protein n=1 Tax=Massarina eburnea CBS 473.64 TaxID=1395130 RepID=A0A6A6SEL6_9PLEO|nr:hypothetical protein P280DRAFT_512408 [Massarina eburnea CBS 473.64]